MKQQKVIHWFRKGLRLHDNPAFIKACEQAVELYPVFILDPWIAKNTAVGINRWRFLLQSLQDLDNSLKALNLRLFLVKGNPELELESLCTKWGITKLTFELDTEPYAVKRDGIVETKMKAMGVEVIKCVSHTLLDVHKTVAANGGKPPLTMQSFLSVFAKVGPPDQALPAPTLQDLSGCKTPIGSTHDADYGVPSLSDLGKSEADCGPVLYPGGETEALNRMDLHLKKTNWICTFEKPNTSPNSLVPSTTVLSPYFKFGCLSARLFYHKLSQVYHNKKHSAPPVSLHGQMLWREFFYTVGAATPNFDRMKDNSVCKQIPWQLNKEHLEAWAHAKTGYPFIDAIMTQLRQEGWIHHLARHAVACFLTRGDLWISWEEGQKVFEELLLDADWSLNAGNWMWLSASAFFNQFFRVYSPIAFGKKTDPNGDYIKKYLPILKKFPAKFIYEPWKAPSAMQQTAGCVIGRDYPRPIVEHDIVSKINIKQMTEAYAKARESNPASSKKNSSKKGNTEPVKSKSPAGHSEAIESKASVEHSETIKRKSSVELEHSITKKSKSSVEHSEAIKSKASVKHSETIKRKSSIELEHSITKKSKSSVEHSVTVKSKSSLGHPEIIKSRSLVRHLETIKSISLDGHIDTIKSKSLVEHSEKISKPKKKDYLPSNSDDHPEKNKNQNSTNTEPTKTPAFSQQKHTSEPAIVQTTLAAHVERKRRSNNSSSTSPPCKRKKL
ncbi:cryptochrome-2-like [Physella acuta]|uniref:cryptochrome-2-like n=1 Tax=Physella acuta TaxID=109671 RepID=UPI0027DD6811|nr:cryptochrome-2-like [Physella acuta]